MSLALKMSVLEHNTKSNSSYVTFDDEFRLVRFSFELWEVYLSPSKEMIGLLRFRILERMFDAQFLLRKNTEKRPNYRERTGNNVLFCDALQKLLVDVK